jgi:HEAT repeat protein
MIQPPSLIRAHSSAVQRSVSQAIKSDSQDDHLRLAALTALRERPSAESLQRAIVLTRPGLLPRTRAQAAGVVAELAEHDRDAAYEALRAMLNSPEIRTRMGAGQALVALGDERALEAFDGMMSESKTIDVKWMVGGWRRTLAEKLGK